MKKHEIYLGGGCFWGTQEFLTDLPGVIETVAGLANTKIDTNVETFFLAYTDSMELGTAECIKVVYDEDIIPTKLLLKAFFETVDPSSLVKQINYSGQLPEAAVLWTDPADSTVVAEAIAELQKSVEKPVTIKSEPLENFTEAGTYAEDYIARNLGETEVVAPDAASKFVDEHHAEFGGTV